MELLEELAFGRNLICSFEGDRLEGLRILAGSRLIRGNLQRGLGGVDSFGLGDDSFICLFAPHV